MYVIKVHISFNCFKIEKHIFKLLRRKYTLAGYDVVEIVSFDYDDNKNLTGVAVKDADGVIVTYRPHCFSFTVVHNYEI